MSAATFSLIHHDLDGVLLVLVQLRQVVHLAHLAVHAQTHETLRTQFVDQIRLLALALHHQRRQDHHLGAFRQRQHSIHHLSHRLRLQHDVMLRTIRIARAGKQQAQIIVNLGDRTHSRARVMRSGFLLDGDSGRKPLDQIDIRLLHQLQELPRIGRKRLHITPLPLGIQGIESE